MRIVSFLIGLFFIAMAYGNVMNITIIPLQNRSAESLVPLIQPMLDKGGVVTGRGFDLIVKTSADNLQQIRAMVDKLDVPAQQLMISVKQTGGDQRRDELLAVGNPVYAEVRRQQNQGEQHIKTLDGESAYITIGQQIPIVQRVRYPNGRFATNIVLQAVNTGFYVLPRVAGNQVTLELRQQADKFNQNTGNINTQHTSTTISAHIGEWVQVRGIASSAQGENNGLLLGESQQRDSNIGIYLKVDITN